MKPIHAKQESLRHEAGPAKAHQEIEIVIKTVRQASKRLVFLGTGIDENLTFGDLLRRESEGGIGHEGWISLGWWSICGDKASIFTCEPRQFDMANHHLLRGLLRHDGEGEVLVVDCHPEDVAGPSPELGWRRAWHAREAA